MKFLTIENGETILYTWQKNNSAYYRKPVLRGGSKRITSAEFWAANSAARARKKMYYEVINNDNR